MKTFVKKAALGVAAGAAVMAMTAAPAQAQRWHRYHHYHHGDTTGAALLGGIIGLGVGAAIASSKNDRYYSDRYYYDDPYYAPPPPTVYEYRYEYRPRCWTQWRWDPYWGRDVRVRVCR
jgi:hypothetical protein